MKLIASEKIEGVKSEPLDKTEFATAIKTAKKMIPFMIEKRGVGLAAPQIGIFKRFFVMKNFRGGPSVIVLNPEIVKVSEKLGSFNEGCLSYPGKTWVVKRPKQLVARWVNEDGKTMQMKLTGQEAEIFHHEYEHLEGVTIKTRA